MGLVVEWGKEGEGAWVCLRSLQFNIFTFNLNIVSMTEKETAVLDADC